MRLADGKTVLNRRCQSHCCPTNGMSGASFRVLCDRVDMSGTHCISRKTQPDERNPPRSARSQVWLCDTNSTVAPQPGSFVE